MPQESREEGWPYRSGAIQLLDEPGDFDTFADELQASCLVPDPWCNHTGEQRFHGAPLLLTQQAKSQIYKAAADIGVLYQEVLTMLWNTPDLVEAFYPLTPFQKLMWLSSDGAWHGFARMDLFLCRDGRIQVCELNADTPSGQTDALTASALMQKRHPHTADINEGYHAALMKMIVRLHQAHTESSDAPRRAAIIYPTDNAEDLTIIRLYQRWLEDAGIETVLGSPFNIVQRPDGGIAVFGQPVELLLRHYKTDWWGERLPVWADEPPYPDPDALTEPLLQMISAERAKKLTVINPMGSILAQNKLTLALFWEEMERFEPSLQAIIRAYIPETYRLETVGREQLRTQREQWVLKSDFGCEGDEVVIGPYTSQEDWEIALELALDGIWVVQRFFDIQTVGAKWLPNFGVYLIAGTPSGMLVRLDPLGTATGTGSRVVAPLVIPPGDKV